MKLLVIKIRNLIIRFLYKNILKPILFLFDPEDVHDFFVSFGKFISKFKITRLKTKIFFGFSDNRLTQNVLGIKFDNPVGLSAGFDKNAELTKIVSSVGFGFEEIGSVTALECIGNPRPRLWRIKESSGLAVYYGLKNDGSDVIYQRLKGQKFEIPIGINVAMTNCQENISIESGINDYKETINLFSDVGDYFTINVSCPNTLGGQPFMEPHNLELLLKGISEIKIIKPIFVKISPDVSFQVLDQILEILKKYNISGIICTNLTKKKENKFIKDAITYNGGVSGKPVSSLSDEIISYIYKKEGQRFVIVGVGGIFTAEDAYRKIKNGATLLELITGMIFEGPQVISQINLGLLELMKKDGFTNISQAIGSNHK